MTQNVISFRLRDQDTEIRETLDEIANELYDGTKKVEVRDVILALVRAYRGSDQVVIPSQKGLLNDIRNLFERYTLVRREDDQGEQRDYEPAEGDFYDDLRGILGDFGVETD